METLPVIIYMQKCLFTDFSVSIQVDSSHRFWSTELRAVCPWVNLSQLLSALWLAATAPHATQNKTGPSLSTCIACSCTTAKKSHMAWLGPCTWSRNILTLYCCTACGCSVLPMSVVALSGLQDTSHTYKSHLNTQKSERRELHSR